MRQRILKSVAHNFLGTYTSRYSDYDGYWVFGIIFDLFEEIVIDLLDPIAPISGNLPLLAATRLATFKFQEQVNKSGFPISRIRDATLTITKSPFVTERRINGVPSAGNELKFLVTVVSDLGKIYEAAAFIFVAPHNPTVERRSTRRIHHKGP